MTYPLGGFGITKSSFDVLSFNPFAWYDSSNTASISDTGGLVDQQNDLSGNGYHLTQAGGLRPTTNANTQNGLNIVDFVADSLTQTGATFPTSGDMAWLIACKITAGFGAVDCLVSADNGANDFQLCGETANNFRARLQGPDGDTTAATSDILVPSVVTIIFDFNDAGTYRVQVNGVDINSGITYTTKITTTMDIQLAVNRGGAAFLDCSMFENILLPTANAGVISANTEHLINKWGI